MEKCTEESSEDCCKGDCREGEGDCDDDSDCANGFICGKNNCVWTERWGTTLDRADCCTASTPDYTGDMLH